MKATKENLERIDRLYDENFGKLVETVGTPEHTHYVARERKLNKLHIRMSKKLRLYIYSKCRLHSTMQGCNTCTGWFKSVEKGFTKHGHVRKRTVMSESGVGTACKLKEI